jgi:hypothetical protein
METAVEFRKYALQQDGEVSKGSADQGSLAPHGKTMAFVRQIGGRGRAIRRTSSSAESGFKATC